MRATLFKLIYSLGAATLLRIRKKDTVTVLCLHRVSDERDFFFNPIKVATFNLLLEYLDKHYSIIAFSEINKPTKKPKVILSFDDGYHDFLAYAFPLLKQKGIPSNHNIVNTCANNNSVIWTQKLNDIFNHLKDNKITNDFEIEKKSTFKNDWTNYYLNFFHYLLTLDKLERKQIITVLCAKYNIKPSSKMMNWEEIKFLSNNSVDIGSHTYSHSSLSLIKNQTLFDAEINKSIAEIHAKTGKKVTILSLPNGVANCELMPFMKKTSIKYVLLADNKVNLSPISDSPSPISRIYLMDNTIQETILRTELFHSIIKSN